MSQSTLRAAWPLALAFVVVLSAVPARAEVMGRLPPSVMATQPVISGNGRFIAGTSPVGYTNPCATPPGGFPGGVFVYDRQTSRVECVSVDNQGISHGYGGGASISADGNLVAFLSSAVSYEPPCGRGGPPVFHLGTTHAFVHNRHTRRTECISVGDAGLPANDNTEEVRLSASGNLVVLVTYASNLVAGDGTRTKDIFAAPLVDGRRAGPFERITVGTGSGVELPNLGGMSPQLSADGQFVTFTSTRADLVPNDTNAVTDVFRFNRLTHQMLRVSVTGTGAQATGGSDQSAVSADGRFVAFMSFADLLGTGTGRPEVYRRDLQTDELVLVSQAATSVADPSGRSGAPRISADGRTIVFQSQAVNLVPGDTNGVTDMFAADLTTGAPRISRVSVSRDGAQANTESFQLYPDMSADGSAIVFTSTSANLDPVDSTTSFQRAYLARIAGFVPRILTGAGAGGGPHVRVVNAVELFADDPWRELFAYDGRFSGGVSVAFGDVDGDGAADMVTGAGPGGGPHVRILSAARHSAASSAVVGPPNELAGFFAYDARFAGGVWVAVADVTGDGIGEIITGAGPGGGPHVRVFQVHTSWETGTATISEYASFFAYHGGFTGGVRVAAGDLDGDGVSEIITAAGPGGGPHVIAWKVGGSGPVPVLSFFAYSGEFAGGVFVGSGDIDGDGRDEILTGAGAGGGPHVRVLGVGPNFSFLHDLHSFFAFEPGFSGGVNVAAGDVNGDGTIDVIVAPGGGGAPLLRAFTRFRSALAEITFFFPYDPAFRGGLFVAAPR